MTVSFLVDHSIFADKRPSGFCLEVIQLAIGVLGIGRQRRQGNDIIQYIDFHLISPFLTVYLLTASFHHLWCPKSETSLI